MSDWQKELKHAVWKNNKYDFNDILRRPDVKSEIREINEWKWHKDPLHKAAEKGRDQMLTKLLEAGAKVNAYSYSDNRKYKYTALHWAALNNMISTVKLLIRNGADENMEGNSKTYFRISMTQ